MKIVVILMSVKLGQGGVNRKADNRCLQRISRGARPVRRVDNSGDSCTELGEY